MAISGFSSVSVVNGVQEITAANNLSSNATASDEQFLIYNSGAVRASGTAQIYFTRCHVYIHEVDPSPNLFWQIQYSSLSYNADSGGRSDLNSTKGINFEDSSIIFSPGGTALRAVFVGSMTNSLMTKKGSGTVLFYTQSGANLDNMHLQGVSWEVNGQPSSAANIKIENAGEGVVNFFLPRLDLTYLNLINTPTTARLGNPGSTVRLYLWNRVNADNTKILLQDGPNNFYYDGITASYAFVDRDAGTPVTSNVTVIAKSDISGSMTTLGTYSLDSNGHLVGTYDSQNETSGSNQTRDTYYLFENYSDVSQSTYSRPSGASYGLTAVNNQLEVRGYLYEPPVGFSAGDNVPFSDPQGALNPDGTVQTYQQFTLNNDLNITEQNILTVNILTVASYVNISTVQDAYDVQKALWYFTNDVALLGRQGQQLDLGATNVIFDSSLGTVGVSTSNTVSLKANSYSGGATATTGNVTTKNSTTLSGGTFNCDINYETNAGTTLTDVVCTGAIDFSNAGTYTLDGCSLSEVTNSSGGSIVLNIANGSTVTTNTGPNITLVSSTTLTLTGLQSNTEVRVYDAGTTTELAGVENSGTTFSANISASSVDIVVHSLGYEYQKIEGADTTTNLTLPIQQRVDRNYRNP